MRDGYRPWYKEGIIIHLAVCVCDGIAAAVQGYYRLFASHYGWQARHRPHTNRLSLHWDTQDGISVSKNARRSTKGELDLRFDLVMGMICICVGYLCMCETLHTVPYHTLKPSWLRLTTAHCFVLTCTLPKSSLYSQHSNTTRFVWMWKGKIIWEVVKSKYTVNLFWHSPTVSAH